MESRQRASVVLTIAVIAFAAWRYYETTTSSGFETRHLGTWTDPAGPPGNRLSFILEWKDLPGAPMSAGEGIVKARLWLGQDELTGNWGFENFSGPLRLNVATKQHSYVVPVEFLPDGRMRLAFHDEIKDACGPNALDGPAAKVLIPIKEDSPRKMAEIER